MGFLKRRVVSILYKGRENRDKNRRGKGFKQRETKKKKKRVGRDKEGLNPNLGGGERKGPIGKKEKGGKGGVTKTTEVEKGASASAKEASIREGYDGRLTGMW